MTASRKGKIRLYPLDKRLGGTQRRSGGGDEKKKPLVLPVIEPWFLAQREHDYVTEHCVQVTVHFRQASPIREVARSTYDIYLSDIGIAGSNPLEGSDAYVCVIFVHRGHMGDRSLVKGSYQISRSKLQKLEIRGALGRRMNCTVIQEQEQEK